LAEEFVGAVFGGVTGSGYSQRTVVHDSIMQESFPRQKALTRGFRLGAPRAFRISADREIALFIRSDSGRNATGNLWCAQPTDQGSDDWIERKLTDCDQLISGELPEQERSRRERMREVTEGITAYSVDESFTMVAFVLNGELYCIDLPEDSKSPLATPRQLTHEGGCIDPQISPNATHIAYVHNNGVHCIDIESGRARELCAPDDSESNVTWGLADFAAAEELERVRGFWWLPDSHGLIIERVDESPVEIAWISNPAQPKSAARAHRYPFAGTDNAHVQLFTVDLAGNKAELEWDQELFPYLVTVNTTGSAPTFSVLSRDQSRLQINAINGTATTHVVTREEYPWHTVQSGVPRLNDHGDLIEIRPIDDSFRLCINGDPVSPREIQVSGVLEISDHIIYTGSIDPTSQEIFSTGIGGLADSDGFHSAVVNKELMVIASTRLDSTSTLYQLVRTNEPHHILHTFTNNAERPSIEPRAEIHVTGVNQLRSVIIWPTHHVPGTKIPVICAPYGGPHAQRVLQAGLAYCSDQWLADHGFAIVITDNRGTPSRGPNFEYAVHNDLAKVVLEDQIQALLDLANTFPDLDLNRVGIHGWSFGGYLAALAVLTRSDFFHAAVAGAPVTDWALYDTAYTERYLGLPDENPEVYAATSLLNKAEGLGRPLLIIHGLADDNVLFANTLQLSGALLEANKEHSVLPLTGVTHMTPQEVIAENLLLTELRFFREHLVGDD
jgi:dipeptidyl-peptidase-4